MSLITTAQPALGLNDIVLIYHLIEGWRTARLGWGTPAAQPIIIGFWSCHVCPGLYSVVFAMVQTTAPMLAPTLIMLPTAISTTSSPFPATQPAFEHRQQSYITDSFRDGGGQFCRCAIRKYVVDRKLFCDSGQVNAVVGDQQYFRITGVVVLPGIEHRPLRACLLSCGRFIRN